MCVQNLRLKIVAVADLRPNGFNPYSRTLRNGKKYKSLLESIRQHGVISPLLVSPDYLVIDGHRRMACALDLLLAEVPCVVSSTNAQLAWAETIFTTQGINGRQIVETTAQGMSPVFLPSAIAQTVANLQRAAGPEFFQQMAESGVSIGVTRTLNQVCRYTGDSSQEWKARVLRWLIKHKMQLDARKAIDSDPLNENGTRERLCNAINRDTPMRATWS